MVQVAAGIAIPEEELDERFVQSGGPGGQNVNKVATTVQLRFDAAGSPSLAPEVRRRLLSIAGTRATADGELVITARRFRTQEVSHPGGEPPRRAGAAGCARGACTRRTPAPRHATRPTRAARERRLQAKARRGAVKRQRTQPGDDD